MSSIVEQHTISYENNLTFLESLSKYKFFSYLSLYINVLKKLNKLSLLKSPKFNINFPVSSDVDKIIKLDKSNNTPELIQILMRSIKPVKSSFKIRTGKFIIINLNNGSKCYIRAILFEDKIKKLISDKNIDNIVDILREYKQQYPYIDNDFLIMGYPTDSDDYLSIFNELLHINNNIIKLSFSHNVFNYYDLNGETFTLIDKTRYLNDDIQQGKIDDEFDKYNMSIQQRINIFDKFLNGVVKSNEPDKYIKTVLAELQQSSVYNMFSKNNKDDANKKKKDKFDELLFNKLTPLMSCIIILQPYSLCDVNGFLFKIDGDFELPKKLNAVTGGTDINKYKSQVVLSNSTTIPINDKNNYNINSVVKSYISYFDNDELLGYRVLWLILLSYHIESLIKECKNDYKELNINNIISYNKLFGIKQYKDKKNDFYKLRIEWIFNLFNEDKNVSLIVPNLINYCNWFIIDGEKNDFFLKLCEDDSDECELEED